MFRDLWSAKLVEEPVQSRGVEIMSSASTPTIGTLGEGCRIRILNSLAQAGQHEVYELVFQHQGSLDNAPHRAKAKEQLMVILGALEITQLQIRHWYTPEAPRIMMPAALTPWRLQNHSNIQS